VPSLSLAIRRFRDGRVAVLGLVVLVLVTSICAALAPRLFDRFADDALRGEFAQATPFQRNIQLVEERGISPAGEPDQMAGVADEGDLLESRMPAGLPPLFRDTSYLAETVRGLVPGLVVRTVPGITAMQALAASSGTVLVEGRETLALLPLTAGVPRFREALADVTRRADFEVAEDDQVSGL